MSRPTLEGPVHFRQRADRTDSHPVQQRIQYILPANAATEKPATYPLEPFRPPSITGLDGEIMYTHDVFAAVNCLSEK